MKRALAVILIAVGLTGCEPSSEFKWVVTGRLTGTSCGTFQDLAGKSYPNNCLAVVKSENPEQTQSFQVDKDYQELLGKRVDVSRISKGTYRVTGIAGDNR